MSFPSILYSFALSFLPSLLPVHHHSVLPLLFFFFLARKWFVLVRYFLCLFCFLFLLSVAFRDIYFLWSERKKELGFPMSGSECSEVGSVVSDPPAITASDTPLPLLLFSIWYTHSSRPLNSGKVGPDEGRGDMSILHPSRPLSFSLRSWAGRGKR